MGYCQGMILGCLLKENQVDTKSVLIPITTMNIINLVLIFLDSGVFDSIIFYTILIATLALAINRIMNRGIKFNKIGEKYCIRDFKDISLREIALALYTACIIFWYIWHIIFINESGTLKYTYLPYASGLVVIFGWFITSKKNCLDKTDTLLFFSILLLIFSVGYFYYFKLPIIFLIAFGSSLVLLIHIFKDQSKNVHLTIGCTLLFLIITSFISGLYSDNHLLFINSINMPDHMKVLSTVQAWNKELVSLLAVSLILIGVKILFIKDKSAL